MAENEPTTAEDRGPKRRLPLWGLVVAVAVTAALTFGVTALLVTSFHRKVEAKNPYLKFVHVDENTTVC